MGERCGRCAAELPSGARFCPACGTPAVAAEPAATSATPPRAMSRQVAGERKPVTALFADVVGSVTLAERMDPEDWSALMSRALGEIEAAVEHYGGSIAKLLGDGVLALFGAETAHEDDPERAVRAAVDILHAFDADRARAGPGTAGTLSIRIGINTGLALVGTVSSGEGERSDMSAYGDTVNVAARLQAAAAPGRALMAAATYRLVAHAVDARDLGETEVRGRSEAVHVYELIGLKAAPVSPRGVEGLRSPMVGRSEPLTVLERLVAGLGNGHAAAAVVIGEPGIGKSRLLAELRDRIEASGTARWAEGRARSYGRTEADHLLVDLVRAVVRRAPDEAARAPALRSLLSGEPSSDGQASDAIRSAYLAAIGDLLRATAGEGPLVAVVEDLHWSDESSAEALAQLLPVVADAPILILASTRDERDAPGWRLVEAIQRQFGEANELRLRPLSNDDSRALVANLLEIEAIPTSTRDQIIACADGNPFFVEETLRMLIDRGALAFRDERWTATAEIGRVEIPETIHGLLLARIDRLPAGPRRVLRVASVIGREFDLDLLADVLAATDGGSVDASRAGLADELERLRAADLVRQMTANAAAGAPPLHRFRHALVQEAAYDSLLRAERVTLHGVVGDALERSDPAQLDELASRISEHFELAGDPARSYPWARRAADAAYTRYALPEAIAQFRRAIAMATDLRRPAAELTDLYLRAGRAIELTDRYREALDLYRTMLDAARARDDRQMELAALAARTTGEAIGAAETGAQPDTEAQALEALELARELGDRATESKLLWTLLLANRFGWGDPAAGIEYGRRSIAIAKEIGLDEQAALSAQDVAQSLSATGRFPEARELLAESIAHWQRVGNLPLAANGLRARAELEWLVGDLAAARRTFEEALAIDERTGNLWGRVISRMGLGSILADVGELESGLALLEEGISIAEPSGLVILQLSVLATYAGMLLLAGEPGRARAHAERARGLRVPGLQVAEIAQCILAGIELADGRPEAARALADPGTGYFEAQPFAYAAAHLWSAPIEAAIAVGETEPARAIAARILQRSSEAGARVWEPEARRLVALAMLARGSIDEAKAELHTALDLAREIGLVGDAAAIERALAGAERARVG